MVDTTRYADWLEMGKKDFKGAEILFKYDGDHSLVCFHCQQAIEKYIKGYLISKTGLLQEGHSLVRLIKKAIIYDDIFKEYVKDCAFINSYYIETRYPAEEPIDVSEEEVAMSLEITRKLMELIEEII